MKRETIVIKAPDHFQEHLPADRWTYHYEVRRNYGTTENPHWLTLKFSNSESEAQQWADNN
jgi:hypothetical protein